MQRFKWMIILVIVTIVWLIFKSRSLVVEPFNLFKKVGNAVKQTGSQVASSGAQVASSGAQVASQQVSKGTNTLATNAAPVVSAAANTASNTVMTNAAPVVSSAVNTASNAAPLTNTVKDLATSAGAAGTIGTLGTVAGTVGNAVGNTLSQQRSVCDDYIKNPSLCTRTRNRKSCILDAKMSCLETEKLLQGVHPDNWSRATKALAACNQDASSNKNACRKKSGKARQQCFADKRKVCFDAKMNTADQWKKSVFAALPSI